MPQHLDWEANTERRVTVLESKMDKLLDPESGIYAKIATVESRLTRWAITILSTIVASLVVELVVLKAR